MSLSTFSFRRYTIAVLLIMLLIAGLLAVAGAAATEVLIRTRVIPNDRLMRHLDVFRSGRHENAVFGDSRTSMGVHGLSGFLNLSYPDDSVPTIEAKVRSYYASKQPGKVILQADPHMFSPSREVTPDYYVRFLVNKKSPFRLWMFTEIHSNELTKYWSLFFQGSNFENLYTFQPDGAFTRRYRWGDEPEEARLPVASAALAPNVWPKQAPAATENGRSYERMLAFLTSREAEVCMVGMPLAPLVLRLIENSPDDPKFQLAQPYYQSLATQYGATYVDMSGAVTDGGFFVDAHHLNEAGALEFAPRLERACFGSSPTK